MTAQNPEPIPDAPRVAIVGAGVMGSTIVTALRVAGWPSERITALVRSDDRIADLEAGHGITATTDAGAAVFDADAVVLAVKPQDMATALEQIRDHLKEGVLVLTVAAALSCAFYEQRLPEGTPVVRAMPNTPSVIARGATAIAAGAHAQPNHMQLAAGMLRATGLVVMVDESQIDAVGAIAGSGPAYFYAFVEALTEAGVAQGLDRILATQLASQTFVGAAALLERSGDTPQELRRRVSSKGGTTLAALDSFQSSGLQGMVASAANAAAHRTKEIAKELEG
jgi:pyrroline-5-carboxylate reductase